VILSNIFKGRLFSTESTHASWAKAGNYPSDFCGFEGDILRLKIPDGQKCSFICRV